MIYEHSYSKIIKTPQYIFDPPIEEEIQEFSKQFSSNAIKQETNNEIKFNVVVNDGKRLSLALLTGLKNIFMKQLPKMPKEYISRLVYDKNHTSMIIVGPNNSALGGITYRLFDQRQFAEIVFCAIASSEQVKGYGSHLMNHLKDYIMMHTNARYFLTYADNYAIGYFKKQGFTKDITLDQKIWMGYIKDYEGGTLMQCTMIPRLTYLRVKEILAFQKKVLNKKIQSVSSSHIVYEGLSCFDNGAHEIDPMDIPGVKDSGYDPAIHKSKQPRRTRFQNQLLRLVSELKSHRASWPFLEPVNGDDVTDYYEIIQNPMDLSTLEKNVLDNKYANKDDFIRDTKFIFSNCRFYNDQSSAYFKSADQLEEYFEQRLSQWRD